MCVNIFYSLISWDLFLRKTMLNKRQTTPQMMPQMFKKDRIIVTGRTRVTISCFGAPSNGIKSIRKQNSDARVYKL